MEHEVYVPFSVARVKAALADRERVLRCVPGLKPEAGPDDAGPRRGDEPVAGRLRLRIGNSTITYRGTLTVTSEGDGVAVSGSGAESRGSGSAEFSLTVVPRPAQDGEGTRLVGSGTGRGDGRLAEFEEKVAASAYRRLLDRFATALADSIRETPPARAADVPESASGIGDPDDNERAIPGIPNPEGGDADSADSTSGRAEEPEPAAEPDGEEAESEEPAEGTSPREADETGAGPDETTEHSGVFDTEVPPPSLDPLADDYDEPESSGDRATAEAAHARRTMIGRSAEEVDHAPPRGRYAPVPAPEPGDAAAALRWAGPAAAVVVAGAVVLGRALRRRR